MKTFVRVLSLAGSVTLRNAPIQILGTFITAVIVVCLNLVRAGI